MIKFDLFNSQSVRIYKLKSLYDKFSFIHYIIYILAIITIILHLVSFIGFLGIDAQILKFLRLFISLTMFSIFINSFLYYSYFPQQPKIPLEKTENNINLAEYLDNDTLKIIFKAYELAKKYEYTQLDSVIVLTAIGETEEGRYIFSRAGAGMLENYTTLIAQKLGQLTKGKGKITFTEDLLKSIKASADHAIKIKNNKIDVGDLIMGILATDKTFQEIIFELRLKPEDIENIVNWYQKLKQKLIKVPFWRKNTFGLSFAREWSYGYANILYYYAQDITDYLEYMGEIDIYGRKQVLEEIERVLSKTTENNILLIGEKGVGKKTIMYYLFKKIIRGEAVKKLQNYRFFRLNTGMLLSGTGVSGEIEMRLTALFNEIARIGNVILFIEDFHNLTASNIEVGRINASEIIHPYLEGNIQVIATTNLMQFHEDIEANPALLSVFEKIEVPEPNLEETRQILEEKIPLIEYKYKVFFTYQDLQEIIRLADEYIKDKPFPQKAIDLIDEVAVKASQENLKIISTEVIDSIVSEKTKIPVSEPQAEEKEKLLNLEEFLHQRIIDQEEAVVAIANALRRARSGLKPKNRPAGTFLFLGPTGVGKTETAKALAEAYFGSEKRMIRLDMSEFQEENSIARLIGTPPKAGSLGTKGELVNQVKDNPFSLVLIDEIEKAHPQILMLFLQVFDEGYLGSAAGEKIDFKNTIIICTSNAGSEFIRQSLKLGVKGEELKKNLLEELQTKGIFKPEFLNRFDGIIAFHPLGVKEIESIAKLMLNDLVKKMKEKDIILEFTDKAIAKLAKIGFDPVYGARPMRRTIQEKVENSLAKRMIAGEIQRGQEVVIDEKDL